MVVVVVVEEVVVVSVVVEDCWISADKGRCVEKGLGMASSIFRTSKADGLGLPVVESNSLMGLLTILVRTFLFLVLDTSSSKSSTLFLASSCLDL